jgi:hypothetical protein
MANGNRNLVVWKIRTSYFIDYQQKGHVPEYLYMDWAESQKYEVILYDKKRKQDKIKIIFLDRRMSESIVNQDWSRDDWRRLVFRKFFLVIPSISMKFTIEFKRKMKMAYYPIRYNQLWLQKRVRSGVKLKS